MCNVGARKGGQKPRLRSSTRHRFTKPISRRKNAFPDYTKLRANKRILALARWRLVLICQHMRKYLVEFIGTFFLVFTVGNTVIEPGAGPLAPIAIGSILMVMIFAGGHISGGHYNPAVTLAVWMRGKCPTSDVPGYMIAQVRGGIGRGVSRFVYERRPARSARWLLKEVHSFHCWRNFLARSRLLLSS